MRLPWRHLARSAVFASFCTVMAVFLPEGESGSAPAVPVFLLSAVIGVLTWPAIEMAERQGASLRPSGLRLVGAAAMGSLFALPYTALVRILPGGYIDISELLATLLFFGGMFYLSWPKIELEIVRRHGR